MTFVNVPSRLLRYSCAGPAQVVEEQVGIIVVVEVDPRRPLAEGDRPMPGRPGRTGRDLLEGAVPPVVIETVGLSLAADEQVEPAVVVVIGPATPSWN